MLLFDYKEVIAMSKCICPKCKSNNIIPIMYGYPTHEAFEEAEKGNIKLGGCEVFIGGGQPDRFCKDCEHEWCVDDFLVEDILKISFRLSVLMLSILHLKNR